MSEGDPGAHDGESDPGRASTGALPSFGDLLRWSATLTGEVARLPNTASRARRVVSVLPEHLEQLVVALDRFTQLLEQSLGDVRDEVHQVGGRIEALQRSIDALDAQLVTTASGVDLALPTLSEAVLRLDQRLEGMDELLEELGGTVVGTINAVPGLRRMGRKAPPHPS